jgi:hypothetical protein
MRDECFVLLIHRGPLWFDIGERERRRRFEVNDRAAKVGCIVARVRANIVHVRASLDGRRSTSYVNPAPDDAAWRLRRNGHQD